MAIELSDKFVSEILKKRKECEEAGNHISPVKYGVCGLVVKMHCSHCLVDYSISLGEEEIEERDYILKNLREPMTI